MTVFLIIPALLFMLLYLRELSLKRKLNGELLYIRERIGTLSRTEEKGYVLIPSGNPQTRELAAALNRLLDTLYLRRADCERSAQDMTRMLTNISHDLRTPLTVLKGYGELMCKETAESDASPALRDMADKIITKADELIAVISSHFMISKIRSGDMRFDVKRINVTKLCHEVLLEYYDILENSGYTVELPSVSPPIYACADADALARILRNLTDNALKHAGGTWLALRIRENANQVMVEVEDHGRGISPEEQKMIFSRNYTTSRNGSGSGLGLTIAKSLALGMDGDLQLSSVPGKGTVFVLILKS